MHSACRLVRGCWPIGLPETAESTIECWLYDRELLISMMQHSAFDPLAGGTGPFYQHQSSQQGLVPGGLAPTELVSISSMVSYSFFNPGSKSWSLASYFELPLQDVMGGMLSRKDTRPMHEIPEPWQYGVRIPGREGHAP